MIIDIRAIVQSMLKEERICIGGTVNRSIENVVVLFFRAYLFAKRLRPLAVVHEEDMSTSTT